MYELPNRARVWVPWFQSMHALPHLHNFQVADIELGDGLGPDAHSNLLGRRRILPDQHLPQVLVHLHAQHRLLSNSKLVSHAHLCFTHHGQPASQPSHVTLIMGSHCLHVQL